MGGKGISPEVDALVGKQGICALNQRLFKETYH